VLASERPQFHEMLAKIRKGESLVVTKIDRLGRDALDIQRTVKQGARRTRVRDATRSHRPHQLGGPSKTNDGDRDAIRARLRGRRERKRSSA
jgi:hypothetical protein